MRVDDRPVPAVTLDAHVRAPWWDGHGQLVVALERLPQSAYVWDDVDDTILWDDPDPDRLVWDAPFIGSGSTDVFCDVVTLELVTGEPGSTDAYRTPYARLELRDPGDGRYRSRGPDGRLQYWSVGRRLDVWWHDETGAAWWLFSGRIATWRDPLLSADIRVEAFGGTGHLAQGLGREWTAGAADDFLSERVAAIVAVAEFTGPVRSDLGDVALTVPEPADAVPLDELRRAAASDGGIVYADVDDTLIVRDRRWRNGRTDQTAVALFTDNVCDAGAGAVIAWNVVAAELDERLAGRVVVANQAGLTATAVNPDVDPSIVFTHQDTDLWTTQGEGDALVAEIARHRGDARLAIGAQLHLHDVRFDYWHQALDLRLGDLIRFVHDDPASGLYDVTLVVTTIRHQITAEAWTVDVMTAPAVAYTAVELWDMTLFEWDSPDPLAVWR